MAPEWIQLQSCDHAAAAARNYSAYKLHLQSRDATYESSDGRWRDRWVLDVEDSEALWVIQAKGGGSGSMNPHGETWKVVLGVILVIVTPLRLFVKPSGPESLLRDLALLLWWVFLLWLIVSGRKRRQLKDPDLPTTDGHGRNPAGR